MSNAQSTVLVIIDPQNDFMDWKGAALPVPGAKADMERLARFITEQGKKIDDIIVTLDTHVEDHIAHAIRWVDRHGTHPAPFTVITEDMVHHGVWRAANPSDQVWQHAYVRLLKKSGGKDLVVWPPHCVKQTYGHRIEPTLMKALDGWMSATGRTVRTVEKGMNRDTEQYGAFAADVVIRDDKRTHFNQGLVQDVERHTLKLWAGEALSHCLMTSFDQLAARPSESIILTDATSPVTGFEKVAEDWLHLKRAEGVRLSTTTSLVL
ncbi:MAG: hypothetical protein RLZZ234_570 [Candidatus Parcubacteria bacterium]|jgi:nicotinamidase-related amidase